MDFSDKLIIAVSFIGTVLIAGCTFKQSTLVNGEFQTSVVERGIVETWETTEGLVQPANEVLLLSPATSIIKEIIKKPGQKVTKGDILLRLDEEAILNNIGNIIDQLEMKKNNLEKTQLNAQSTRADLSYNAEVKKLKIASIKSVLADEEQLLEVGGISQAKIDKTKQELVLAEKEFQLTKQKNAIRLEQLKAEERGLELQISMQEKELSAQRTLLEKMKVKAPSDGIILNVHGKEGELFKADNLLVSLSDLTRFEISATIADKHKDIIKTGKRAYVLVDNRRLEGRIGIVKPTLSNGNVEFTVALSENDHPSLAPNQKVSLQVVRKFRSDVLRVKAGPAFNNSKEQISFLVNGDSAHKCNLEFGLITDDYIEIKQGASEGMELIITDINKIKHLQSVHIVNN